MKTQILLISGLVLTLVSCGTQVEKPADTHAEAGAVAPTNRTPIPATVRKNLGITFATATYRAVNDTIVVPGSFELLPSAQQHYPLPLSGRVTIHVKLLQEVKAGDLLIEIDAPDWHALQLSLAESEVLISQAQTALLKAEAIQKATAELSDNKQAGPNLYQAEVLSAKASLAAARTRFEGHLAQAATLTGLSRDELLQQEQGRAHWARLNRIQIRASDKAVIQEITTSSQAWQEAGAEIIHAVQTTQLRFHGQALQADLDRLKDGQQVSIKPPTGHRDSYKQAIRGQLHVGVSGDRDSRLIDVYVNIDPESHSAWLRPQVAVMAEVCVAGSIDDEELAVPLRGVITDGLDKIIFRRDPKDPDQVIRIKADLGASDGEWVVVESGLMEHDEIVIGGIYELKLATTGQKMATGHFHADGTFHEGSH